MILHQALMFLLLSRMGCCFYHHVHSVENDHDDHAAPTDYSFSYGVKDYHSGDHKQHWEKKEGHIVRGGYSLLEPDGSVRSVDYTADPVHGFQAVVSKSASGLHPQPQHPETHPQFHHQQAHPPVQQQEQPQVNHQEQPQVNHQQHHIVYKEDDGGNYQQYGAQEFEHFIYLDGTGEESRVEETKSVTVLPVDPVAVLHSLQENVIPVDVTYVKPMEISLKHMKFVLETTKAPPKLERGFKPILATSPPDVSHSYSKPLPSQLYKSGKKPKTTPGLRNYASKRTRRIPVNNNRGNGRGPSQRHHQRRRFGR